MKEKYPRQTVYTDNTDLYERCEILADYIIENKCTVRKAAAHFRISKSTVHKDITKKLCNINRGKFEEVHDIIQINKSERHLRGGLATKHKYELIRNNKTVPLI